MNAIDQTHNQNIAVIKAYRGTIGQTKDKYKVVFSLFLPILLNLLGGLRKGILVTKFYKWDSLVGRMRLYSAKRASLVKR